MSQPLIIAPTNTPFHLNTQQERPRMDRDTLKTTLKTMVYSTKKMSLWLGAYGKGSPVLDLFIGVHDYLVQWRGMHSRWPARSTLRRICSCCEPGADCWASCYQPETCCERLQWTQTTDFIPQLLTGLCPHPHHTPSNVPNVLLLYKWVLSNRHSIELSLTKSKRMVVTDHTHSLRPHPSLTVLCWAWGHCIRWPHTVCSCYS